MILIGGRKHGTRSTSLILIGLILLTRNVDNPFEIWKGTYADVDLGHLFRLEQYLKHK